MPITTIQQNNFVNNSCAKYIHRGLTTNFLGLGRDDDLLIRIITTLTRDNLTAIDQLYRALNNQNESLPAKLQSMGGNYGHFLSALAQSTESFHGMIDIST